MEPADESENLFLDYESFVAEDFDVKGFADGCVRGSNVSQQLTLLGEGISRVEVELAHSVSTHLDELLSSATNIDDLEELINSLRSRVLALQSSVVRISERIDTQYSSLQAKTNELKRVQRTTDLARRIVRLLNLSRRLHTHVAGGGKELGKCAATTAEIDYMLGSCDLTGIDVLKDAIKHHKAVRLDTVNQARAILEQGLSTPNPSQIATGLQVFYSLSELAVRVEQVYTSTAEQMNTDLAKYLSVEALSRDAGGSSASGKASMPVNPTVFRANLWTGLDKMFESVRCNTAKVECLERVCRKKRDPVTQELFSEALSKAVATDHVPLIAFWTVFTTRFKKFLEATSSNSFMTKQTLEAEYPKLVKQLRRLLGQIGPFLEALASASQANEYVDTESADYFGSLLLGVAAKFEQAYLSRSLSIMFDPVELLFPEDSSRLLRESDVDSVVKNLTSELSVVSFDAALSTKVCRNVAKTVDLFCVKCEQLIAVDGAASQVIGQMTEEQLMNIQIINAVSQLHTRLMTELPATSGAHTPVSASLQHLENLENSALQPLLASLCDAIDSIIDTCHSEDFTSDVPASGKLSPYMRELRDFLNRAFTDYMSPLSSERLRESCLNTMIKRCMDIFMYHTLLIRGCSNTGTTRLVTDYSTLLNAVQKLISADKQSDAVKAALSSAEHVSVLLQLPTSQILQYEYITAVPYSLTAHLLLARAPPQLKFPHEASSWSITRYFRWLDEHESEADRIALVKMSLETYSRQVRSRGDAEYATEYPIMMELLRTALPPS